MRHKKEKTISQKVYRYLHENASIILLIIDKFGVVKESNAFARKVFGKEPEGKLISEFIVDFKESLLINELLRDSNKEKLLNVNTPSGLPETYFFQFSEIDDDILILGKIDIEEVEIIRKQFVSNNTELTNLTRELQKANAELKKLNQLKNQFLGMAAHDLRNPLGVIYNLSVMLETELEGQQLTKDVVYFLKELQNNSQYSLNIVTEFLDYAQIESGNLKLNYECIDISDVIDKCQVLANHLAGKRSINIVSKVEKGLEKIEIDPSKMEQVINNILFNAIEHSPENSNIELKAFYEKERLLISVKDFGEGMTEEMKQAVFKPYRHKGSKKASGRTDSVGLGMAIAKLIVDSHKGDIWCESILGEGTEFFISLPLEQKGE